MDQAVRDRAAAQPRRDRGAARDRRGASSTWSRPRLYPNPVLRYALGNLVLGHGQPAGRGAGPTPGFFGQPVQTVGVSEIIDVWAKRSARIARRRRGRRAPAPAGRGRAARDRLRRALGVRRRRARAVASASSRTRSRDRYDETIASVAGALQRGRHLRGGAAQDRARGPQYQNAVIDAEHELDVARAEAGRAARRSRSARELPGARRLPNERRRPPRLARSTHERARASGPTCARRGAARDARRRRSSTSAKREAFPDISLGVGYTHSDVHRLGRQPEHARR